MSNIDFSKRVVDYISGMVFGYGFGMVTGYYLL